MVECTAGRCVGFDVNVRPSRDGPASSIVGVVSRLARLALRENFIQPTKNAKTNATPPRTPPVIALTGGLLRDVEWPNQASVDSEPIPALRRADHLGGHWHQKESHVKPYADLPERRTSEIEHKVPTPAREDGGGTETVPLERRLASRPNVLSSWPHSRHSEVPEKAQLRAGIVDSVICRHGHNSKRKDREKREESHSRASWGIKREGGRGSYQPASTLRGCNASKRRPAAGACDRYWDIPRPSKLTVNEARRGLQLRRVEMIFEMAGDKENPRWVLLSDDSVLAEVIRSMVKATCYDDSEGQSTEDKESEDRPELRARKQRGLRIYVGSNTIQKEKDLNVIQRTIVNHQVLQRVYSESERFPKIIKSRQAQSTLESYGTLDPAVPKGRIYSPSYTVPRLADPGSRSPHKPYYRTGISGTYTPSEAGRHDTKFAPAIGIHQRAMFDGWKEHLTADPGASGPDYFVSAWTRVATREAAGALPRSLDKLAMKRLLRQEAQSGRLPSQAALGTSQSNPLEEGIEILCGTSVAGLGLW
ncbi:hypothetical protein C8F04DRAFT_1357591 [Mycena alexandri]|uniref:Uncharacterized protein n=1 Tax=Mycena alexandri TaxID=1745969 RepID=A0AAD6SRN9_9AGAR|nr:hypothetical protein C8F04DRAFT_1357591 [Mycena alexandri]